MKIVRSIADLELSGEIGLVPTMGALHDGHRSLLRAARSENEVVVASLFVNPAQFGEAADLATYPRDEERDARIAAECGVDVLFTPSVEEMYPPGFGTWVDMDDVGAEEAARPGHFRGVATICLKLFNIVQPRRAYFGQKDAQQGAVLERLVRDFDLPVEIRLLPTVRDTDGLAWSSRNVLLSAEERAEALALPRALHAGADAFSRGEDARAAQRPRTRLRRDREPRRRERARRGGAGRLDEIDRQRRSRRRADMSAKPSRYASWTAGKLPLPELLEMKRRGEKIVMVTAYDAPSGRLADAAGVDLILVGDSSGMVVHGRESTVPVTLEEILLMTQWVSRGAKRPLVIADMPFGSYEASNEQAIGNAVRLVKDGGADAVKLERGGTTIERAKAIVDAGIPVMGHVGLTPQTATVLGGFKAQGRTADRAEQLIEDALGLQEAGCFAIVLEAVPPPVARAATRALAVPTIGIGAGGDTDGQVLVWHDMLGYYEGHAPRFVKRYAELGDAIVDALGRYAEEVRSGTFPEEQHTYKMPDEERAAFEADVSASRMD